MGPLRSRSEQGCKAVGQSLGAILYPESPGVVIRQPVGLMLAAAILDPSKGQCARRPTKSAVRCHDVFPRRTNLADRQRVEEICICHQIQWAWSGQVPGGAISPGPT